MKDFPRSGSAVPSVGSYRPPGRPVGDRGAEAAAFSGYAASASRDPEHAPWHLRKIGPYYVGDLPLARRIFREHLQDPGHALSCAGPHHERVPHPCRVVQWATRVTLAQQRGRLTGATLRDLPRRDDGATAGRRAAATASTHPLEEMTGCIRAMTGCA